MGAILNGLALHGGVRPVGSTFLIFSDYMRPPIRLAALCRLPVIYAFSHDSIGLGEDGPTHQPIEQLAALRAIPDLVVLRPADATETVEAWRAAIGHQSGPVALVLTRQKVGVIDRTRYAPANGLRLGAYVLADAPAGKPALVLIGSGSEVELVLGAYERLSAAGIATRAVSMPSMELFARQPQAYRDAVIPPGVGARLAVEAASPQPWYRWVGDRGVVLAIERFGASAPYQRIYQELGLTVENVVLRAADPGPSARGSVRAAPSRAAPLLSPTSRTPKLPPHRPRRPRSPAAAAGPGARALRPRARRAPACSAASPAAR